MNKTNKPFLKWVGGKTQIIDSVFEKFPKIINGDYHEPFVGGGSVILCLLNKIKNNEIVLKGNAYCYDLNSNLINLYNNIKNNPDGLITELTKIVTTFNSIEGKLVNRKPKNIKEASTSKESYYFWIREEYNKNTNDIENSAMFVFLNKTCFRGLYRIGPKGYNVPYGNYKNPSIFEKSKIKSISELIKNVNFINASFDVSFNNFKKGDYIYIDPPYVPINEKSFTKYTKFDFDLEKHNLLFEKCKQLQQNDINFLMSNAYSKLVTKPFSDKQKFKIDKILCKRRIDSKKPDSTAYEIFIYPIKV